jgi:hypothetical protein
LQTSPLSIFLIAVAARYGIGCRECRRGRAQGRGLVWAGYPARSGNPTAVITASRGRGGGGVAGGRCQVLMCAVSAVEDARRGEVWCARDTQRAGARALRPREIQRRGSRRVPSRRGGWAGLPAARATRAGSEGAGGWGRRGLRGWLASRRRGSRAVWLAQGREEARRGSRALWLARAAA